MITLYERSDCPFCWKVRIALAELKLDYESVDTELGEKHPEVLRLSPTGSVPVLVEGSTVIWESSVILDYLDRCYSPGRLIPAEPAAESRIRLLQIYSDKVVGGCLRNLVFEKRSKREEEWDSELIRQAEVKWVACQTWLEDQLEGATFFGDGFSAADCALAARFGIAAAYGAAVRRRWPKLHTWYESVTSRDSWKTAYPSSFIRTE